MKLVCRYRNEHNDAPPLWHFLRKHMGPSFKATVHGGYGNSYWIYFSDIWSAHITRPWIWERLMGYTDTIELLHPEHFSDYEDAIRLYESKTGGKVRFEFWQGK